MCFKEKNIQKRLLSEATLPLEKALEIAVAMEMVAKDANELQAKTKEAKIQNIPNDPKSSNCFRCGDFGYSPNNCRLKNVDCHSCGKRRHIKRSCLSSKRPGNETLGSRKTKDVCSMGRKENLSEEDGSDQEQEVSHMKVNNRVRN